MNMMEARGILIQEATELLAAMKIALLDVERNGASAKRINEIFQAAHTIKGSACLFDLDLIVGFTHMMKKLLVRARNNDIIMDAELTSLLLQCVDYVGRMIDVASNDELQDPDPALRKKLLTDLRKYDATDTSSQAPNIINSQRAPQALWQIDMKLSPDTFRKGMEPVSIIYYLSGMGLIQTITTHSENLPAFAQLDAEQCYLHFSIQLRSRASQYELEQALELLLDDNDIRVFPLVEAETHSKIETEFETKTEPNIEASLKKIREEQSLLKVEVRKLDQLIGAVGEVVTRSANSRNLHRNNSQKALQDYINDIEQFVEQIRERALDLRMSPVGEIFQRFPQAVRDFSKELGKKIDLWIEGADTELDKSLADKLGEPLMHIIRNVMAHGIEPVAVRLAAGKPEQGSIRLNAYHETGSVVIEITDDGKGLDIAKIFAKASARGLVDASQQLTEQQIFMLIFEPGFSTAETATNLFGRDMGMDVVRRNIEELRGTIEIQSYPEHGTRFRIRLPVTLSIIDGFQIAVGKARFVIPVDAVVECVDSPELNESTRVINWRGTMLPYIRLTDEFSLDTETQSNIHDQHQRQCLLVLQCGEARAGVVADRLVGELQAVIKPLSPFLLGINGLAGSTILGDGTLALILDVAALLRSSRKTEHVTNNWFSH